MATPTLSNGGQYLPIGTYIGQYISPRSVNITSDRRLPVAFGKGSRLAQAFNTEIRRAFISAEELTFSTTAPFQASLSHTSDGTQDAPVKLYKSNGQIITADKYFFVKNTLSGKYDKIQIRTEVFEANTTYLLDFQSDDRTVLDILPVNDLRQLLVLGDSVNQNKYREYEDFYLPMDFTSIVGRASNLNAAHSIEVPVADGGNTGSGTIVQSTASTYTHDYNRFYNIRCTAASGIIGSRVATFEWDSTPVSGGNFALPPSPIHSTAPTNTFTIQEANIVTLTQQLELGVEVTFAFGASNFAVADLYNFNALGASLYEVDLKHLNGNEITNYGPVFVGGGNTGTGSVGHAASTNFSGLVSVGIALVCTSVSGSIGTRQATFAWSQYRELGGSGTFSIDETTPASLTVTLVSGIKIVLGFGSTHFVVGDVFSFLVDPPMKYVFFKDDREVLISTTASTAAVSSSHLEGTFSCNTPEGGFGNFSADANVAGTLTGRFDLPDNLTLVARNMIKGGTNASRHVAADKHDYSASLADVINFSLTKPSTDERSPSVGTEIVLDVTGVITGTPNTYYTILSHIPLSALVVIDSVTSNAVAFTQIANSPYIYFASKPVNKLVITYRHKGEEPDPSQSYFITANYLRPAEFFNTLRVVNSLEEGRRLLGPAAVDNDLYISNEIAWVQPGNVVQVGFVQVADADQDGVFTNTDYRTAIVASETSTIITDRCVLNHFESLSDILASNVRLSDPFKSREHLVWIGCPINTTVGDIDTDDSLVFLARRSLQVYGDSPAHGTRILVSPTYCSGTIQLQDGSEVTVTLDGSFYAWAQACKVAGFTSTSDSILLTNDAWFTDIQVHSEAERLKLGNAGIVYPIKEGTLWRVVEDITVDKLAPDFTNINAMVQKQDVTKAVRALMNTQIIGRKFSSGELALSTITDTLYRTLIQLQIQQRIASYQDENGNVRPLDPKLDLRVYRNTDNPTEYAFHYNYFLTYITKRLFGLYSVDTAKLDLPPSGNL